MQSFKEIKLANIIEILSIKKVTFNSFFQWSTGFNNFWENLGDYL